MFDIFIKKRTLIIDCFTEHYRSFEFFPIQESSKFMPDWWKSLSTTYPSTNEHNLTINRSTIKRCEGLIGLYSTGFIIPLWSDLVIETTDAGFTYQFSDNTSSIGYHTGEQKGPEFKKYIHTKLHTPWRIREKTGVKFLFLQPSWNMATEIETFHTPPGVIDFKNQHSTHINSFLLPGRRYEWAGGRPMAQIIPLSDYNIELKMHYVGSKDADIAAVLEPTMPFFLSSYQKMKKIKEY